MTFSSKAEYGVRLMVELGRQEGDQPTSLKAIAEAEDLPLSYLEHVVASLSYANRRRVEISRALVGRPRLVLLDEPAAGMNPAETLELMDQIRSLRDLGVTVLLIEHKLGLVNTISDRVVVLDYGKKIAEGPPAKIKADPRVQAAYLGADEDAAPEEEAVSS